MAESKTIDQLPRKVSIAATDIIPVDDGAQSYGLLFSVLLAAIPGITGVALSADNRGIVFTLRDGTTQTITTSDNRKQDKLTFDTAPTSGSSNPVTSGGVKTVCDALSQAITDEASNARTAEQSNADAAAAASTAASAAQTTANNAASAASTAQTTANNAASAASAASAAVTTEKSRAEAAEQSLADALDNLGLIVVDGRLCAIYG